MSIFMSKILPRNIVITSFQMSFVKKLPCLNFFLKYVKLPLLPSD